ncbi:MAG: polysaccharide biosynthesis C-terminal domain-containing protein, partial [Thermoplasmata archaeon]|nr:polysaccharide biosynthesis C-terminal domain-containing protein [Thermoplasmata archaeon]
LTEPAGNVFLAIGKTKTLSMTNLLNLVILLIFIYPATVQYGIEGISFLIVMMYLSHMIILWWLITKNMDVTFSEIGDTFRGPLLASILMLILMMMTKVMLGPGIVSFMLNALVGMGVYMAIIYAYEGDRIRFYWRELRKAMGKTPS